MPTYVMVLADGETYTQLNGCVILAFDHDPTDEEVKNPLVNQIFAKFSERAGLPEVQGWNVMTLLDPHSTRLRYNRPMYATDPNIVLTTNETEESSGGE